jgi:hypothetical protein
VRIADPLKYQDSLWHRVQVGSGRLVVTGTGGRFTRPTVELHGGAEVYEFESGRDDQWRLVSVNTAGERSERPVGVGCDSTGLVITDRQLDRELTSAVALAV